MEEKILDVKNAKVFYRIQGKGPLLLIIQGGSGDADLTSDMVDCLRSNYTVLTYDRRGLSRSKIYGDVIIDIDVHADDVSRIINAVESKPILVFATSLGAIIGLRLLERHPSQILTLIAHEPPVPSVLPVAEAIEAESDLETLQTTYNNNGFEQALKFLSGFLGINPEDREPGATPVQITPQFISNMNFYFKYDVAAGKNYRPDLELLRTIQKNKLIFAAGEASHCLWPHQCAKMLAFNLKRAFEVLPGAHNGPTAYPKTFAIKLINLLDRLSAS